MKKFKKNDLRLEKEVISALTENDLESVKGGVNTNATCMNCPPVVPSNPTFPPVNWSVTCATQNINCIKPITGIGCTVNNCNSDEFRPISNPCQPNYPNIYQPVG